MSYNRARQGVAGGAGGGGGGGDAAYVTLPSLVAYPAQRHNSTGTTPFPVTMDAVNEGVAFIGQVLLAGGPSSGPKTISAGGGGKLWWRAGASTVFSDAGTTLVLGIQDLDASGEPDDTFDVSATLVGGTDTITSSSVLTTAMESGTKSLDHGDMVSVTFDMTARGGSDSVKVEFDTSIVPDTSAALGAVLTYNGTTWSASFTGSSILIEFDDGTYGVLTSGFPVSGGNSIAFNGGTDPDEYGNLINPIFACKVAGVSMFMNANPAATFELSLYEDPLGTPSLLHATLFDAVDFVYQNSYTELYFDTEQTLLPGTEYAITIRSRNSNNIIMKSYDLMTAGADALIGIDSTKYYAVERTDNSGPFTDFNGGTAKTRHFHLNPLLSAIKAAQS